MFIAMNHFKVLEDKGEAFEQAWRERESFLDDVDGFVSFHLVAGANDEDGLRQYASHTVWRDEAAFRAWTESEAFRKAHSQGKLSGILAGPPKLACWTAVPLS
ncbi:antibiotic biosynthesis monooxygenase family protein [Haliangium ochraceum]|uniref:Antibiotic biosynthesis monooxygenase n=1 Tax=Haliangium ochraceum (strain DSM 14365 / JCM 11303 / SMP-2) TaxID=502025 RepID=D0LK78_HALO1|nr:antibiotic biosynthesis monooxygenase [Haliangium ochraceum]ACY13112.1 Antibiotic biosynthesis monooxygenase [Haliangium ochraceum DSM 14365]